MQSIGRSSVNGIGSCSTSTTATWSSRRAASSAATGSLVDAEQPRARIEPPIGRAEGAGVAADIQHDAGAERDALQQVVVRMIGICGTWAADAP